MAKETDSISQVQEAEMQAGKTIEKSLSKKQANIEEASSKARQIVADAEQKAKDDMSASLALVQKELDSTKGAEAKATQKMVEGIKKRKLSKATVAKIADEIARAIAGE